MRPLTVRKEIDGFVADRLLEALWREALWLVHDDIATVEEVDDAVRFGAGLRWALMGSFQTYRIAGGDAGMRHFMAQFGPALKWPWTKLMDVPELTDPFLDKIAEQSDVQAAGRSPAEMEHERDRGLIAMLRALSAEGLAAGGTLKDHRARTAPSPQQADLDAATELRLLDAVVPHDAVDYNGHMTESHYLALFGQAADGLLAAIGLDDQTVADGHSYFTAESHLQHLGQLKFGQAGLRDHPGAGRRRQAYPCLPPPAPGERRQPRRDGGADVPARRHDPGKGLPGRTRRSCGPTSTGLPGPTRESRCPRRAGGADRAANPPAEPTRSARARRLAQGEGGAAQRPFQTGSRFSAKARAPSSWSSLR
ncbi:MAG: 3-hydroxyacyl-CoA dehydrogenase family protein [Rhodovibrio sp.]|nr:3-hydroxyacyl-CoA dehydrogenase family protein [Rhodovibrio sp.]